MFRASLACLLAINLPVIGQEKAPELFPPDAETLQKIEAKRAELRKAIEALPKATTDDVRADVEVYAKAAEWIVRHKEWLTKDSVKQTLAVLDAGLERAKQAKDGKTPWRDVRNKPIVRGYHSHLDNSVQPYCVTLPEGYGEGDRAWRLDVVLHGRDQTLTEVKFIAQRESTKSAPKGNNFVVLEPYGRGNNAYRWAGEMDVFEAEMSFDEPNIGKEKPSVDSSRRVLRGFSMGGAGTWHLGLHRPGEYAVIGPGAGFTTTRGYVKNLPAKLPDYQEACLRIYDAVYYAENAFNVPIVAYSGEKDPQKAAADNIEAALNLFKHPVRFTHLIAPGLEHKFPLEWQAKAETEYAKYLTNEAVKKRHQPDESRFVTYTTMYAWYGDLGILAMDRHYEKAVVEVRYGDPMRVDTQNVRLLQLAPRELDQKLSIVIDGTRLVAAKARQQNILEKVNGKWSIWEPPNSFQKYPPHVKYDAIKRPALQGPIDDAFMNKFVVIEGKKAPQLSAVEAMVSAKASQFTYIWDKYFRGRVMTSPHEDYDPESLAQTNLVLFGTPSTNRMIARLVPKLPIKWTQDELVVNGVTYDAKIHVPVLICPNPLIPGRYVVINSGHTFREADLKGTNALLYPRLGDWAVLKVAPTEKDPAAAEVVAAGLFDEFWQFPKK